MGDEQNPTKEADRRGSYNQEPRIFQSIISTCKRFFPNKEGYATGNNKEHQKRRQIAGLLLSLVVATAFDIVFAWPESHLFAVLLAGIYIIGQVIENTLFTGRQAVVSSVVIAIITLVVIYFVPPMPKPETETHGWLVPANDPTPPNQCLQLPQIAQSPPPFIFMLGDNTAWTTSRYFTALRVGNCTTIHIEQADKGLKVSGDIFAQDEKLVAHIDNNEFNLVSNELSYSVRRDESTLAVYDPQGREMLYIRYLNPETVDIRGQFYCNGLSVIATPDRRVKVGTKGWGTNDWNGQCQGNRPNGFHFFLGPKGGPSFDF